MAAAVELLFSFRSPSDMQVSCPRCRLNFPLTGVGVAAPCCPPVVVSATLTLPPHPHPHPTTAAASLTLSARRVQVGMSGGGIVQDLGDSPAFQKDSNATATSITTAIPGKVSPELSPSTPITFLLPSSGPSVPTINQPSLPAWPLPPPPPDSDLERLSATMRALRNSGWYYEGLSWQDSAALLTPSPPGTFLVRDSSDPRFLFSLSVQTERGPTSVRLHYHDGYFRLDAAPKLVPFMPVFRCVVRLVEYYVEVTNDQTGVSKGKAQVWVDCSGQTYSSILLTRPLRHKNEPPRLAHWARLALNRLAKAGSQLPTRELPESLKLYLKEYPFSQ